MELNGMELHLEILRISISKFFQNFSKMAKAKNEKKTPIPHFSAAVDFWFKDYEKKKGEPPEFDGSAPSDFKNIFAALKKRADKQGVEWTESVAIERLNKFLQVAYQEKYLQENWMLFNINRQKEKIFANIIRPTNGKTTFGNNEKPLARINDEGSFGTL